MALKQITLQDVIEAAEYSRSYATGQRTKRPRLAQFAAFINAELGTIYEAKMEHWWGTFDRKIPGTRIVHRGKRRECMMLRVYRREGGWIDHWGNHWIALEHNPLDAYASNDQVARWILDEMKKAGKLPAETGEAHGEQEVRDES